MKIDVDPEWWKTIFDEIYLATDARSVCNEDLTRREVDVFLELSPARKQDRILDLCGGHGRHSLELCRRGFDGCTVLDFSATLLQIGREMAEARGMAVRFLRGDARQTRLAPESFDRVLILGNSLGYILQDDADRQILVECHRLLTPGGRLLIDVTDGRRVREHFSANAWHEIGRNLIVCRQRALEKDRICAREIVLDKRRGLLRDQTYAIRLYEPETFAAHVQGAGFSDDRVHRGFEPHRKEGDFGFMNHRMVATARKGKSD
jgi:D-alanine-D-alanine ligase